MNTEFLERAYWRFITPQVCGNFWYYVGSIFLNLLYKNVFISLRKACLRVIFILRWEADVSSRASRRGCSKYSQTNEEKLNGKGCDNDLSRDLWMFQFILLLHIQNQSW